MTEYDGWGAISLMVDIPLEHINSPRPVVLQAIKEGKSLLAHFCKPHGIAVCGKANIPHQDNTTESYWKKTYGELLMDAIICEKCKELFLKEFNEEGFPLDLGKTLE